MPDKRDLRLEPDGTLRVELIGPDDTGLDSAEAVLELHRRFAGRDVSLEMAKDRCVFEGLPPPLPERPAAPAGAGTSEDLSRPGPSGPAGVG